MEDLKEGIAKIYYQYSMCGIPDEYELEWANETECTKQACYAFTDYILTYLKANGVVKLAEDQAAPCAFLEDNSEKGVITQDYLNGRASLVEANFKRVEELI